MRVLIVCSGDWIERWASFIHALSQNSKIELSLVTTTPKKEGKKRISNLYDSGVNVHVVKAVPGRLLGIDAATIYGAGIFKVIRKKYDIIHFIAEPSYIGVFQFLFIKKLCSPSTKTTIRAAQNVYKRFPFPFKMIERYTYRNINLITPLTGVQKEILDKKGYTGNIEYIGNGYDDGLFKPMEQCEKNNEKELCFGFVGYFENYKGIYTLLKAINKIKHESFTVKMVGNGKEKGKFKSLVNQYNITDKIKYYNVMPQTSLPHFYESIDCLILPSEPAPYIAKPSLQFIPGYKPQLIVEQFGRVLAEAMGMKKTVIGSDCGGIPDVIGNAGYIFKAGDYDDLANKMLQVLKEKNKGNIKKLGDIAYNRAESQFRWNNIAEKYIDVWSKLESKG